MEDSDMSQYDFDLLVVGAGSGGVRAARVAAGLGKRVAVAEQSRLGGTCVNLGCVPKKLMVYAAQIGEAFADGAGFGWSAADVTFDWSQLKAARDREVERLNGVYRSLLTGVGVNLLAGRARLVDQHTVEVDGERHTTETVLIATGGVPWLPSLPGIEHALTSDDIFALDRQPERIVIVGGGYIAVEFAGIFNALGTHVTQLYRGPLFLRGFDDDISTTLADEMQKRGIDLRFDTQVECLEHRGPTMLLHTDAGEELEADLVLYAVGRRPLTGGIGLEEAGVELDKRGAVVVDAHSRTSVPSIYAVGDCTERMNLTPVAIAEAMAFIETVYGSGSRAVSYENVPTAVFSQPNVATVGLTETEARTSHAEIEIYRSTFRPMKHTLSGRDEKTMMKLVVNRKNGKVLGVHMVGPDAGEIMQGMAVALTCGATKAQLDATVGIHPTAAEELVTMRQPVR
jgi:glutathione reductase (NADPH)